MAPQPLGNKDTSCLFFWRVYCNVKFSQFIIDLHYKWSHKDFLEIIVNKGMHSHACTQRVDYKTVKYKINTQRSSLGWSLVIFCLFVLLKDLFCLFIYWRTQLFHRSPAVYSSGYSKWSNLKLTSSSLHSIIVKYENQSRVKLKTQVVIAGLHISDGNLSQLTWSLLFPKQLFI